MEHSSKTTPKDFFLWAGAVVALYGSVISLTALLFEYINSAFPDSLASYADPYGGAVRSAMAGVIVLMPTTLVLVHLVRKSILEEPGKEHIWVRRWALVLTISIAVVVMLVDLITLITYFLGGDLTVRFGLKVLVVLLVGSFVFLHFMADLKGYWLKHVKKAGLISSAILAMTLVVVVSGFFIIGSPHSIRMLRYDEQKVSDLQNIQYQIVNYWQTKRALPEEITALVDTLSGFTLPIDPQTKAGYVYKKTGPLTFELCATFNQATFDGAGRGSYPSKDIAYPSVGGGVQENWQHDAGEKCFTRTIDPERYPVTPMPTKGL